ncbi:MAG TPA: ABC transporter permease [Thermoplasmata archaeon]|nr:ABC transporter permease [Thermoplasmata archaeon]
MAKLRRIVARRLVNAVITIFGIIVLNYVLIRLMPGNPGLTLTPHDPKYAGVAALNREIFGLDKPPWDQFVIYLQKLVTGDWGISYWWKTPVINILAQDLGWTLLLVGTSTVLTILVGMVVGSYAAWRRGKPFDLVSTGLTIFLYGMPTFWMGIMLKLTFSPFFRPFSWWPTLPGTGYYDDSLGNWAWDLAHISSTLQHLILPALTLTVGSIAGISLVMRSSLIDVMTEDFVLTARAKGLSERQILRRHIFPNGLPPMVSLIAMDMAFILGGAYQTEWVFGYRGIGWETINAIDKLDYPLLQFIVVVGGVAIVIANLVSDFILLWLDPRIKIA